MSGVDELCSAAEGLVLGVDGADLRRALQALDRVQAKLAVAIGAFDAAELWDVDGAHSMAAWLSSRAGLTGPDARRLAATARRLRTLPATRDAWLEGRLSGGQVRAVCDNVTDRTAGLFAEHEGELVPHLAALDVAGTAAAMRAWAARARSLTDPDGEPDEPERDLHLSPLLDGRRSLRGGLDAEGGQIVEAALRLAESPDPEGQPARTRSRRRGDALVDLCRWFLDHQHGHSAGRQRPHLDVVVDLAELEARGQGRFLDGTPVDATTLRRLACDAGVHRVITDGLSTVLDYGRTTRTISPELWTALVLADGGRCRAPWCDRPHTWCEAHHVRHWHDGGPTRLDNLALYCTRDHQRFHRQGWRIKLLPDRTIEHTGPDGRVHVSRPPPCRL